MKHFLCKTIPSVLSALLFFGGLMRLEAQETETFTLTLPPGYSLIANPLIQGDNTITELFPHIPPTSQIAKWQGNGYTVNQFQFGAWTHPDQTLKPGEGAFFNNPLDETTEITFKGIVPEPFLPEIHAGYNLISLPLGLELSDIPVNPGDQIVKFEAASQEFETYTYTGETWVIFIFDGENSMNTPKDPGIKPAEPFFYFPNDYFSSQSGSGQHPNSTDSEDAGSDIYFNNYAPGVFAPLPDGLCEGTYLSPPWSAQLLALDDNDVEPIGQPLPFLDGLGVGFVDPTQGAAITIPWSVSPGGKVEIMMRIFTDGYSLSSFPFEVQLNHPLMPPANLVGLRSFQFISRVPTVYEDPRSQFVSEGQSAQFNCGVEWDFLDNGLPMPEVTWYERIGINRWQPVVPDENKVVENEVDPSGWTESTLTLHNVTAEMSDAYKLRAQWENGDEYVIHRCPLESDPAFLFFDETPTLEVDYKSPFFDFFTPIHETGIYTFETSSDLVHWEIWSKRNFADSEALPQVTKWGVRNYGERIRNFGERKQFYRVRKTWLH